MNHFGNKNRVFQFLKLCHHHQQQWQRSIVKVRLKWVKNRSLDHIIDKETDLKAACLLKDAVKRSSARFLTAKSVADWQKLLGLTVPVLRFLRRYPSLFEEFPHPRWPSLPCFRLTDTAKLLDSLEEEIHQSHENDAVERLSKVLMMMRTKTAPLHALQPLKWDLGLSDCFEKTLIPKFPEQFQLVKYPNGLSGLKVSQWREDLAVSALQKMNECRESKRGKAALVFPMRFPRGYGSQKKVRSWMEEFEKLPYISPYADCSKIDPESDLMEKRVVGVLHEFLSLSIHKKTKRNYLRSLREELSLPHKFTRIFTRYPGIFYLSLKCKTITVTLREAYQSGKLVDPHPLARHRDKFYHVMRTGLLYRAKGALVEEADPHGHGGEDSEEVESSDELCENEVSDSENE